MTTPAGPLVAVVGSVNLDLVATLERLPRAGETLTARSVGRHPGGKGANQALAAARLGARVRLHAAVGDDPLADEALVLLREGGVDLTPVRRGADAPTGTAMIHVDDAGDTTIVVDAGANATLTVADADLADADVVLTVLEVPDAAVAVAVAAPGFTVLNAAPARAVPADVLAAVDLLVVNAEEHAVLREQAGDAVLDALPAVAVSRGADGGELRRRGEVVATAAPPSVRAVDGTAAGDTLAAALAIALTAGRPDAEALRFACAAGALTATRRGAQPALPHRAEVDALLS